MEDVFNGQTAYDHVHHLSVTIGPRLCGTSKELEAFKYAKGVLESFGLKPRLEPFTMVNDEAIESTLEILEPALGKIKVHQHLGTPVTPAKGLTAPLVFAEGMQEPQIGPHIEGKIVVITNGPTGGDRKRVLRYKPAAILMVGSNIGSEPNTFHMVIKSLQKPYQQVPSAFIAYEDALRLFNAGATQAKLTLKAKHGMGQSHYLVADVKGSEYPEEIVVIGGHIDSVPNDPGATDNAAGVATVLELARVFAKTGSKRTLRFAAWGSEEQSGGGASWYMKHQKDADKKAKEKKDFVTGLDKTELDNHLLYLNLDVLGMSLGHNGCHVDGSEMLGHYVKALSSELGVPHEMRTDVYGSDNITFFMAGVPSLSFARLGTATQHMHTIRDSIDLISVEQMEVIGRFLQVFIERTTAKGHLFPFTREVPKEKVADMQRHDLYEKAVMELISSDGKKSKK